MSINAKINRTGSINAAMVRVKTTDETIISCYKGFEINENNKYVTKTCTNGDNVIFNLPYGSWRISNGTRYVDINIDTIKIYDVDLLSYPIYGISIDMGNPDSTSAVTYTDDAVGFTPISISDNQIEIEYNNSNARMTGSDCNYKSWSEIITNVIGCRPCLYKNGRVVGYLKPDNYNLFIDETPADIISGESGDVMIEFKRCYYEYTINENTLTFRISEGNDTITNSGVFEDSEYIYYGAYEGFMGQDVARSSDISYKLRSKSDSLSLASSNFLSHNFNIKTRLSNTNYYFGENMLARSYILGLLMLVTKTRDIQSVIGAGFSTNESGVTPMRTGLLNTVGLFGRITLTEYNSVDQTISKIQCAGVKAFGIENLWGNRLSVCDDTTTTSYYHQDEITEKYYRGIYMDNQETLIPCSSYNIDYSKYQNVTTDLNEGYFRYIKKMKVIDKSIIIPSSITTDTDVEKSDTEIIINAGWKDGYICLSDSYTLRFIVGGGSTKLSNILKENQKVDLYSRSDNLYDMGPFSLIIADISEENNYFNLDYCAFRLMARSE